MIRNDVRIIVDRPKTDKDGEKPNILDSRWVMKRKNENQANEKFKARLVVRGFKDRNEYDLRETYASVSRLAIVRLLLSVVNKYGLHIKQLDVKTAFLNPCNEKYKQAKVCKLQRALYGLKIGPKRWNERFTEAALKIGLTAHDNEPCFFTWREGD